MFQILEFGIRSVPPCSDCWENGQCSMNCGPSVRIENGRLGTASEVERVGNSRRSGVRRAHGRKPILAR